MPILAALDLHSGRVTARVEPSPQREFILLLKDLDWFRLILGNHSAHMKETKAYLATRPNRFKYVHATHGSWLNIVDVWQDGAHVLEAFRLRRAGTNSAGDRGDQRGSGGSPLEEVRGA